jgi:Stealth protein CR2, conserved region 2/Stealth protein CR3, conserved region 3/Stealth protein CR4, conserved region 4/Stealth protein CR1, conserved region 1
LAQAPNERTIRIVDPETGLRDFARADVVVRKGQLTLLNDSLTPIEASIEDLLAIADALSAAQVAVLLVRGEGTIPVLAVDHARRRAVTTALATAFENEPFYSKAQDSKAGRDPALLIADGKLAGGARARILRLFRPRVDSAGRLRYGAASGVRLEFWDFGTEDIVAPAPNAIMRSTLPRAEAVDATALRFGREWNTLAGMFDPLASDITFDIDIVFSWVDGSSAEFQRMRALRMQSYVVGVGDDSAARYRQLDELRYALRSVHLYAPWIRRIFIVTDSPTPAWLADHPSVTIVPSSAFFLDQSSLPTHNSHAIESQLHHIEGLSEHFLYSNDDMFFARPVSPDMFFSPGGVTKFIEATTRIGLGENSPERSGFENAARVNRALLRERFGRVTTRHLEHAPTPLRRSVLFEMEEEFAADFARTAASPFRSATDISVTNSLYHYYALMTGRAVVQSNARVTYVETTLKSSLRQMKRLLRNRSQDFFCLNDGSAPEISIETRTAAVLDFLNSYFPIPAPWEIPESLQVSGTAAGAITPGREPASS